MRRIFEFAILSIWLTTRAVDSNISLGICSLSCNEDENNSHMMERSHIKHITGSTGKAGPEGRMGARGQPGQKGEPGVCDCSNYQRLSDEVNNLKAIGESLQKKNFIEDCKEAKKIVKTSGVTVIFPLEPTTNGIHVYCNQDVDNGGWIVMQRRVGGPVDFYRGWVDYQRGFGNKEGDFWLGLEVIHLLTMNGSYELRVDLEHLSGDKAHAKYSSFRLGGADEGYKLNVSGYSGNAGDGLEHHNGMQFTTKDRKHDKHPSGNCASFHKGAWWYNYCHTSNLNGLYGATSHAQGVSWRPWKNSHESLKVVEMKIRKVN